MSVTDLHSDILQTGVIDSRINFLHGAINGGALNDADALEDARDELAELKRFRTAVRNALGQEAWDDSSGMLADAYFSRYQFDQAREIYGSAVDQRAWHQDEYAEDQRSYFAAFDLDDVTYLADSAS